MESLISECLSPINTLSPFGKQVMLLYTITGCIVCLVVFRLSQLGYFNKVRHGKGILKNSPIVARNDSETDTAGMQVEPHIYPKRNRSPVSYRDTTACSDEGNLQPTRSGIPFKVYHCNGNRSTPGNKYYTLEFMKEICESWGLPCDGDKHAVAARLWSIFGGRTPR